MQILQTWHPDLHVYRPDPWIYVFADLTPDLPVCRPDPNPPLCRPDPGHAAAAGEYWKSVDKVRAGIRHLKPVPVD